MALLSKLLPISSQNLLHSCIQQSGYREGFFPNYFRDKFLFFTNTYKNEKLFRDLSQCGTGLWIPPLLGTWGRGSQGLWTVLHPLHIPISSSSRAIPGQGEVVGQG